MRIFKRTLLLCALSTMHAVHAAEPGHDSHATHHPQPSATAPAQAHTAGTMDMQMPMDMPMSMPASDRASDAMAGMQMPMGTSDAMAHGDDDGAASPRAVDHVPPDPPQHLMTAMPESAMSSVMDMNDDARFFMFKADALEWARSRDASSASWDTEAWYGGDFNKLVGKLEGEREGGRTDARAEALWDHAFASYWDWQLGMRRDFGSDAIRDWAAFGVQGLAPYWFDVDAAIYLGEGGRTAFRVQADYDLLFTQRLILQPKIAFNLYGKADRERAVAAGLSDAEFSVRLRYEIRRELAPYVGLVRQYRRAVGVSGVGQEPGGGSETKVVAGLRLWF